MTCYLIIVIHETYDKFTLYDHASFVVTQTFELTFVEAINSKTHDQPDLTSCSCFFSSMLKFPFWKIHNKQLFFELIVKSH